MDENATQSDTTAAAESKVKIIPNQGFEDYLPNMVHVVTEEEAKRLEDLKVAARVPSQ